MWLHSQGDIKKVAAYKVKHYELKERNISDTDKDKENNDDQVMLEDSLKEVDVSFNEINLEDDNDTAQWA